MEAPDEKMMMHEIGFSPTIQRPINNIGVVYCTSTLTAEGREFEKIADCEVIEVAHAIQAALQAKGLLGSPGRSGPGPNLPI